MSQTLHMNSLHDIDTVIQSSMDRPVVVFKHSTTCPISARAHREWESFLDSAEAQLVTPAFVRVIEERPISLGLSDRVGVRHESPQVLLLQGGKVVWHDSHNGITVNAIKAALAAL